MLKTAEKIASPLVKYVALPLVVGEGTNLLFNPGLGTDIAAGLSTAIVSYFLLPSAWKMKYSGLEKNRWMSDTWSTYVPTYAQARDAKRRVTLSTVTISPSTRVGRFFGR